MVHHGYYMPFLGGGSFVSWLLAAVALGVLVAVLVRLLRPGDAERGNQAADRDHSLDILKNRLAQGDISEQEYLRMRDILKQ